MQPIGGKITMNVDGERIQVRGNVTSNIGQDVVRTVQTGLDGVHGFTEEHVAPYIQVSVTERPDYPLSRLNQVTDSTVTAELADGRTLILSHAAQVGELERNIDDGSIGAVRFEGEKGQEMGA